MDDARAKQIKATLDLQLKNADPNVGIAFGSELFAAFRMRGWLTLETFGVLGTTQFAEAFPAYGKSHFAFVTWDVPDDGFQIGKNA
jgi:hypothetical protein